MTEPRKLAWGAKVSAEFRDKVLAISSRLHCEPDHLMSCMAFETAGSFSPSKQNAAGSGAVGLIQFMPKTARSLGTTPAALAAMTAVEQLAYVEKYMRPYMGKLGTVDDMYMAILYPAACGKSPDFVLFRGPTGDAYRQNRGLDKNGDGLVTKGEAAARARDMLTLGMQPGYLG